MIIDFHTHAFPDHIADRAMKVLSSEVQGIPYYLDGKLSSLIQSMDNAGIDISIVASIATKPSQFESIIKWSQEISSDRIIPFPSVHPKDSDLCSKIRAVKDAGFKGIKMHPYYQDFTIDDPELFDVYSCIQDMGLVLLMHTGYDIAFERIDRAGPTRIINIVNQFPKLKFVSTHLGAWQQWDQVAELLVGKSIFMGTSYTFGYLDSQQICEILTKHPRKNVLFGTDSPWTDQKKEIENIKRLDLPENTMNAILGLNACKLLGI